MEASDMDARKSTKRPRSARFTERPRDCERCGKPLPVPRLNSTRQCAACGEAAKLEQRRAANEKRKAKRRQVEGQVMPCRYCGEPSEVRRRFSSDGRNLGLDSRHAVCAKCSTPEATRKRANATHQKWVNGHREQLNKWVREYNRKRYKADPAPYLAKGQRWRKSITARAKELRELRAIIGDLEPEHVAELLDRAKSFAGRKPDAATLARITLAACLEIEGLKPYAAGTTQWLFPDVEPAEERKKRTGTLRERHGSKIEAERSRLSALRDEERNAEAADAHRKIGHAD
jgi:hypothetical protein